MNELIHGSREFLNKEKVVPFIPRVLLGALLSLAMNASVVRDAEASPRVDGPAVCFVNDDPTPNFEVNPDPINFCPENGEVRRLAPGVQTDEYLTNYKDGFPHYSDIDNKELGVSRESEDGVETADDNTTDSISSDASQGAREIADNISRGYRWVSDFDNKELGVSRESEDGVETADDNTTDSMLTNTENLSK